MNRQVAKVATNQEAGGRGDSAIRHQVAAIVCFKSRANLPRFEFPPISRIEIGQTVDLIIGHAVLIPSME